MLYICSAIGIDGNQKPTKMKKILQNQILRLAKIYTSKEVSVQNFGFHNRVLKLQVETIKLKKAIRK